MGAQANIVDSVHIFIAIAAHKGLAAYALGSSVVDSQVGHTSHTHFIAPQSDCSLPHGHALQPCQSMILSHPMLANPIFGACAGMTTGILLTVPQAGADQNMLCKRSAIHALRPALNIVSWVDDMQASMQKFWTVIGFFATATPLGILLGVLLSSVSNSDAAAAVSALASGLAFVFCSGHFQITLYS